MKIGSFGVKKVNTTNATPIRIIKRRANFSNLQLKLSDLNNRVYKIKATAAETMNIIILSKSGDLPNAPL